MDIAEDLTSLAEESASLAKEQSGATEEISDTIVVQLQAYTVIVEPRTYLEAVGDPKFGHQWEVAIYEELNSLVDNETWQLEELLPSQKAVTSKWVFKVKRHLDGSVD